MSDNFEKALAFTLLWECEFVRGHWGDLNYVVAENVAGDPGGVTKFGIDQRDHGGVDIRALTLDGARAIYHAREWTRIRGDAIASPRWAMAVFDCAVNPGLVAIGWIQLIFGTAFDGIMGSETIAALNTGNDRDLRALLMKRDLYYRARSARFDKFKSGWLNRNRALRAAIGL